VKEIDGDTLYSLVPSRHPRIHFDRTEPGEGKHLILLCYNSAAFLPGGSGGGGAGGVARVPFGEDLVGVSRLARQIEVDQLDDVAHAQERRGCGAGRCIPAVSQRFHCAETSVWMS
jgi:hypothetical protein